MRSRMSVKISTTFNAQKANHFTKAGEKPNARKQVSASSAVINSTMVYCGEIRARHFAHLPRRSR